MNNKIERLKLKVKKLIESEKTFTEPFEVDRYVLEYLSDFDIKYIDDLLEIYSPFYIKDLDVYLLLETEEENINENETIFSIKNIELYKGLK